MTIEVTKSLTRTLERTLASNHGRGGRIEKDITGTWEKKNKTEWLKFLDSGNYSMLV